MVKGLGKGINALFNTVDISEEAVTNIDLKKIDPNPYQPRKIFDKEAIGELSKSIKIHGILQPIIVRPLGERYQIVVGERRFRAAKEAKLKEIPAVVRKLTDAEMMEISVIENLQRKNLSPLEEAESYQFLMKNLNLTQIKLAERIGKSRPYVANFVRLLSLPSEVQKMLRDGLLSMGHGRALLGLKHKKNILPLAKKAVRENFAVRELEKKVNQLNVDVSRETKKQKKTSIYIQESESRLREKFGTAVSIKQRGEKGKVEIAFFSNEDLNRILEVMNIHFDED